MPTLLYEFSTSSLRVLYTYTYLLLLYIHMMCFAFATYLPYPTIYPASACYWSRPYTRGKRSAQSLVTLHYCTILDKTELYMEMCKGNLKQGDS